MLPVQICPEIFWIGLNDRTTDLFEGLWPVKQEGVSLNSYFIDDEKKVIVDATRQITLGEMLGQLAYFTDLSDVDYLVLNHMEPDHTGALSVLRQMSPHATILCSERAAKMLAQFYGISAGVRVVADGETLNLGRHTLKFVSTPNLHWPETMMTLDVTEKVLFSCDAFGGFGSLEGSIFDNDVADLEFYEREALRYYTNIIGGRFRPVLSALRKLADEQVAVIAPSHGLVWRGNPGRIIDLYRHWAELTDGPGEVGVTVIHGSMHGDTDRMAEAVQAGLQDEGMPFTSFEITHTHPSYILPALWLNQGVLVGAPTYEGEIFPPVSNLMHTVRMKRLKGRLAARFGSYGWSGGAQRAFEAQTAEVNWNLGGSFEFIGSPTADDLRKGREFGAAFARQVRQVVALPVEVA